MNLFELPADPLLRPMADRIRRASQELRYQADLLTHELAHDEPNTTEVVALTEKVIEGSARVDALHSLEMRMVCEQTVARAASHALDQMALLAGMPPPGMPPRGSSERRYHATLDVYVSFLRELASAAERQ